MDALWRHLGYIMSILALMPSFIKSGASNPVSWLLTGSTGTPNLTTSDTTSPEDAIVTYWLSGNSTTSSKLVGAMNKDGYGSSTSAVYTQYTDEFVMPRSHPWGTVYVRLTANAGAAVSSSSHVVDGATWHALLRGTDDIHFTWQFTGANGNIDGSVKVEIASDSGGTDIIATGYYRGSATVSL